MSDTLKNTMFRSLRSVRIASTTGHVLLIEPGTPVAIPPSMHEEAYAAGCVPVDSVEHTKPLVPQGDERERSIIDAIHVLIAKGDDSKFRKTDGVPKVAAIEELFGFAVAGAEIEVAFEKIKLIAKVLNDNSEIKEDKEDKE